LIRPRTLIPILLLTSTPAFAKPPPPDAEAPEALIELRSELFEAGEQALKQVPRFRALCDAEGYPLVGNLVRKSPVMQPSQFCAAVRSSKA
jgi:hypothetical protein